MNHVSSKGKQKQHVYTASDKKTSFIQWLFPLKGRRYSEEKNTQEVVY